MSEIDYRKYFDGSSPVNHNGICGGCVLLREDVGGVEDGC